MAELQLLLQSNGAFKSELLQSFLSSSRGSSSSSLPPSSSSTGYLTSASPAPSPDMNLNVNTQFDNINSNLVGQNVNSNTNGNTNGNTVYPSSLNSNQSSPHILSRTLDNSETTTSSLTGASPNLNLTTTTTTSSTTNITDNINATVKQMDSLNMNAAPVSASVSTSQGDRFADLPFNKEFVDKVLNEVKQPLTEVKTILAAQVSNAVTEAHMETTINTYANVAEANERIKSQPPPPMPDMSKMAMNPSAMWQKFTNSMKPEIAKVVKFCKKLPGFSEISGQDQMLLIKQGTFEVMITRFCILIDHVKEEMFDPSLKMKSPRHVVKSLPTGAFVDGFFDVAKLFNPLELTDGEIAVYTAVLMFCPDRKGLTDITSISTLQQLYLQSLYNLLKQSHQDADSTFSKVLGMIPVFHKMNEEHVKFINSMKMKMPSEYNTQFPPLHKDVFDEKSTS